MARTNAVGWASTALLVLLVDWVSANSVAAQLRPGASVVLTTPHVWRGLTRVNEVSLHPEVYLGSALWWDLFLTVGVWSSVDLDRADSTEITDRGPNHFGVGEVNLWAEIARPLGAWTVTLGVVSYKYFGSDTTTSRTDALNTSEGYARLHLDRGLPLLPVVAAYRDWGRLASWYLEGSLTTPAVRVRTEPVGVLWGFAATLGRAEGQSLGALSYRRRPHYADNGWTHVDFSTALQLDFSPALADALHLGTPASVEVAVHAQRNLDPATRRISAAACDQDRAWRYWVAIALSLGGPVARAP